MSQISFGKNDNIKSILRYEGLKNPLLAELDAIRIKGNKNHKIVLATLEEYLYFWGFQYFRILEWGEKVKINYKTKKEVEPIAKIIQSLWNLCKECHALQDFSGVRVPHSNAFRWFINCYIELVYADFVELYQIGNYQAVWDNRLQKMKKLEFNVYNLGLPHENLFLVQDYPSLNLLLQSSHQLEYAYPLFGKRYWKPLLNSIRELKKEIQTWDKVKLNTDGETYQYKKSGRGDWQKTKYFEV